MHSFIGFCFRAGNDIDRYGSVSLLISVTGGFSAVLVLDMMELFVQVFWKEKLFTQIIFWESVRCCLFPLALLFFVGRVMLPWRCEVCGWRV
jgi:hypothetical protein